MSIVMTACVVNYIDGVRFLIGIVYKKEEKIFGENLSVYRLKRIQLLRKRRWRHLSIVHNFLALTQPKTETVRSNLNLL